MAALTPAADEVAPWPQDQAPTESLRFDYVAVAIFEHLALWIRDREIYVEQTPTLFSFAEDGDPVFGVVDNYADSDLFPNMVETMLDEMKVVLESLLVSGGTNSGDPVEWCKADGSDYDSFPALIDSIDYAPSDVHNWQAFIFQTRSFINALRWVRYVYPTLTLVESYYRLYSVDSLANPWPGWGPEEAAVEDNQAQPLFISTVRDKDPFPGTYKWLCIRGRHAVKINVADRGGSIKLHLTTYLREIFFDHYHDPDTVPCATFDIEVKQLSSAGYASFVSSGGVLTGVLATLYSQNIEIEANADMGVDIDTTPFTVTLGDYYFIVTIIGTIDVTDKDDWDGFFDTNPPGSSASWGPSGIDYTLEAKSNIDSSLLLLAIGPWFTP